MTAKVIRRASPTRPSSPFFGNAAVGRRDQPSAITAPSAGLPSSYQAMRRMALTYRARESLERTVDRQSNRTAGSYRRNIMTYIDGIVAAVPTANREKFKKHADEAAAIFKE